MQKAKIQKTGNVILNVLLCVFLVICIFLVLVSILSKRSADGTAEVFGYQMRVVTSESMEKCEHTDVSSYKIKDIPLRSMVFIRVTPDDPIEADAWYRDLKEGDVLTFRYVYATQITITHRITSIEEKDTGGFIIELAGDNKNSKDGQLVQTIDTSASDSGNYVIGEVESQARLIGAVMSFLMKPVGIILVIIAPCVMIILFEVLKIVKTLGADKKKREQEEKEKAENELMELRRKLSELEKEKTERENGKEDKAQ